MFVELIFSKALSPNRILDYSLFTNLLALTHFTNSWETVTYILHLYAFP